MVYSERSGGVYCENCNKCLAQPRKRKEFRAASYILCEECHSDVLQVAFRPSEESILTNFKVRHKDIPGLIVMLQRFCKDHLC